MVVKVRTFTPEEEQRLVDDFRAGFFYITDPAKGYPGPDDTDGTGDLIPDDEAKESPFRPDAKALISELISELESKAHMKNTHAAPHVRTAAGVLKFRQSMGALIRKDKVPNTLQGPKVEPIDATPDDKSDAPVANKLLSTHVRSRVTDAQKRRKQTEADVALKMDANAALHPSIKEKLEATEAGREWLRKQIVPDVKELMRINGYTATGIANIPIMRKRLIEMDPNASKYTAKENQDRADQMIGYVLSEDPFVIDLFNEADQSEGDAYYGMMLVSHLWQGNRPEDGSVSSIFDPYLTPLDEGNLREMRAELDKIDPVQPVISKWTRKLIDTWASSAFDSDKESIAMQATAETLYGGDSNVTRFPHVKAEGDPSNLALAKEVDKYITDNAPFLVAFTQSVYEQTQKSLTDMKVRKLRLFRGMQVTREMVTGRNEDDIPTDADMQEFKKTVWPKAVKEWTDTAPFDQQITVASDWNSGADVSMIARNAFDDFMMEKYGRLPNDAGDTSDGYIGTIVLQPLSATATTHSEAENFTSTYGSGTAHGAVPMMFTMDVPKERIWSIPTHGPGCLGEDEVIILGGQYTAYVTEEGRNSYATTIDERIDDLNLDESLINKLVASNVVAAMKADIPKGDGWEAANQKWYDLIGTTVNDGDMELIAYGKKRVQFYSEWSALTSSDESPAWEAREWFLLMRGLGYSKTQAAQMAKAVRDKFPKQKYVHVLPPKPVKKKGPAKKKIAMKKPADGSSFTPSGSGYGYGGPAPHHPAKKMPLWKKKKVGKKLIKKAAKKTPPTPVTGVLASGMPKALVGYSHFSKGKYGEYTSWTPAPKAVRDVIVAMGWTSNTKGTAFYPPTYEQEKYQYEKAVHTGSTDPKRKKVITEWMKTLPPEITYAEASILYGYKGKVKIVGGSTLRTKPNYYPNPELERKLKILGWGQPIFQKGPVPGQWVYVMKRSKKEVVPPKPPKWVGQKGVPKKSPVKKATHKKLVPKAPMKKIPGKLTIPAALKKKMVNDATVMSKTGTTYKKVTYITESADKSKIILHLSDGSAYTVTKTNIASIIEVA